jgi:hypothetical protein
LIGCTTPRQTRQRPPVNRSGALLSKHVSRLTVPVGLYPTQCIPPVQLRYELSVSSTVSTLSAACTKVANAGWIEARHGMR